MGYHVVADENLQVTPALRAIADSLTLIPGREICRTDLSFADVLLVRSVTRVTQDLVADTPVRFVGTATAGMEHIDTEALAQLGIAFSAAPGSNAVAVVEYVLTALASCGALEALAEGDGCGIVGYGQVGRRLTRALVALGATVQVWDPLVDVPAQWRAASLQSALSAPVVSLHAALHSEAPHPSQGLVSASTLPETPEGQIFINAGRGGLVTQDALDQLIARQATLLLDTWPDEPRIAHELLNYAQLATPHIAGYSFDAKARATDYLVTALQNVDGVAVQGNSSVTESCLDKGGINDIESPSDIDVENGVAQWLTRVLLNNYDIHRDDHALRDCAAPDVAGEDFDALRRAYPLRRELAGQTLWVDNPPAYQSMADIIGVQLLPSEGNPAWAGNSD